MRNHIVAILIASCSLVPKLSWSIPFHAHGEFPTTWESDAEGTGSTHPNNPALGNWDPEAGDTRHQHYDAAPLVDRQRTNEPFSVWGVWDNRTAYSLPAAAYPVVPHGFIDESNVNNIPRYRFFGDVWNTDNQAKSALPLIDSAFQEWSALQAGVSPVSGLKLITGLAFAAVKPTDVAEIDIIWGGTNDLGINRRAIGADGIVTNYDVHFKSTVDWFFGKAADTPVDKYHFYSTALHEIGHVVGLWEQLDKDDIMYFEQGKGSTGAVFDTLDVDSKRGAYALYSIPVSEPSSIFLLSIGVIGLVLTRKRPSDFLIRNVSQRGSPHELVHQ